MAKGAARAGFDIDLADGALREDAFARVLLDGRERFEHKRDYQCTDTGNVAIEFEASTLPNGRGERYKSGISKCEAYWFVIEFAPDRRLMQPTEYVKDLARRAFREGRCKWVGDDNRFHCALVPVGRFVEP